MLSLQDRVRIALEEYGERDIAVTVDELARRTKLQKTSVYQALYRLSHQNEIELIKEPYGTRPGRDKIIGVRLIKMARHSEINRVEKKTIDKDKIEALENMSASYPTLITYMKKRLAVENAKEQILSAGLDPENVIKFDPDPMGEEAMSLMQKLIDKTKEAIDLKYERDAAKRDIEFYETQKKIETQKMLAEG